jgi:hypothetical protein
MKFSKGLPEIKYIVRDLTQVRVLTATGRKMIRQSAFAS